MSGRLSRFPKDATLFVRSLPARFVHVKVIRLLICGSFDSVALPLSVVLTDLEPFELLQMLIYYGKASPSRRLNVQV